MADKTAQRLQHILHTANQVTLRERLLVVAYLSWPAIMAQLSSILMEYIDAAMVGSLGAAASASIGLVATSTWLLWGMGGALSTGFAVQVAHFIGARKNDNARDVFRQSLIGVTILGLIMLAIGAMISAKLPIWLGGDTEISPDASSYFLIVSLSLPFCYLTYLSSGMLRCSGNMVVPGLMNVLMCVLDVIFNFFLIFDSHTILGVEVPGAGLGVSGAALGTGFAQLVTGVSLIWYVIKKSSTLNFRNTKFSFRLNWRTIHRALIIGAPIAAERIMMCGAQIITTVIVAPLGTAAIAANAFGITAESLCYMPGYGISEAAQTLSGQSLGAGRKDLTRGFGKITIALGIIVMTIMGVLLWIGAPLMMAILTPVETVRELGVSALRIEAFAEPMFAAAIVTYGVMVGAGYTFVPACINLGSIWVVRLSLAALLAPVMGLDGVWLAMCIELCVRGSIFLITFVKANWMKKASAMTSDEREIEKTEEILNNFQSYDF